MARDLPAAANTGGASPTHTRALVGSWAVYCAALCCCPCTACAAWCNLGALLTLLKHGATQNVDTGAQQSEGAALTQGYRPLGPY